MAGKRYRTTWKDLVWLLLIFEIAVAVHGFLGDFFRQMTIYPEEWTAWTQAERIWRGQPLAEPGINGGFGKAGYALVLSPLFSISDPVLRVRVLGWLNSVLMATAIFPVWLVGKELGLRRGARYLAVIACCLLPETLLSMTFLAENLYWPLVMCCVWLHLMNSRQRRWPVSLLEGVLGGIACFVCESYLVLAAAFLVTDLAGLIRNSRRGGKIRGRDVLCLVLYPAATAGLLAAAAGWGLFSLEGGDISQICPCFSALGMLLLGMAMLTCAGQEHEESDQAVGLRAAAMGGLLLLLTALCYAGSGEHSAADQLSLAWVELLERLAGGGWRALFIALIGLLTAGFCALLWQGKWKNVTRLYLGVLLAAGICSWAVALPELQRDCAADEGLLAQVQLVNEALAETGGETGVLLVADRAADRKTRGCLDTYLTVPGELNAPAAAPVEQGIDSPVIWTEGAEYLVVSGEQLLSEYIFESCEDLTPEGVTDLRLYRCNDPEMISLTPRDGYLTAGSPFTLWFFGEKYNAENFVKKGIYEPEEAYSWTRGSKMKLEIPTDGTEGTVRVEMEVSGILLEEQRYVVVQNRREIHEGLISGAGIYAFELEADGDDLQFTIEFPDAAEISSVNPQAADDRTVALQLRRMTLWID